ncbi:MAG: hypothetical protein R3F11_01495 [Verrucomicrobiales bacterium]
MKPHFDAPSLGTVWAGSALILTVAQSLFGAGFTLPPLMWIACAVTIFGAWRKRPAGF